MVQINEILSFINTIKYKHVCEIEDVFTNGFCYWFAVILSSRFNGEIWFNPFIVHFATKIDDVLYDITGIVTDEQHNISDNYTLNNVWYSWDNYQVLFPETVESIVDSCILKTKGSESFGSNT